MTQDKNWEHERRISELEAEMVAKDRRLQALEMSSETLKVALIGIDGSNGIRGTIRELRQDVRAMRRPMWVVITASAVFNILFPILIKLLD